MDNGVVKNYGTMTFYFVYSLPPSFTDEEGFVELDQPVSKGDMDFGVRLYAAVREKYGNAAVIRSGSVKTFEAPEASEREAAD